MILGEYCSLKFAKKIFTKRLIFRSTKGTRKEFISEFQLTLHQFQLTWNPFLLSETFEDQVGMLAKKPVFGVLNHLPQEQIHGQIHGQIQDWSLLILYHL